MKTFKYFLFFVLSCTAIDLTAQVNIGAKGGYTKAWEDYGDVNLPENAEIDIAGFNMSVLAYLQIGQYLKVGVEPGFVQRGAACVPGWQPIFQGDTKFFLNYAELPLMVSGHLPLFQKKFEIFGKAGYGASYLASAYREQLVFGSDDPAVRTKMPLDEDSSNLNRWDHGFYGGLGLGYNFGRNQIFFETDYYRGQKDAERFNESKNRSVNFSIGYLFKL